MKIKFLFLTSGFFILMMITNQPAFSDVRVSTIGTYSDSQVSIDIFIDTTNSDYGDADSIVSYGIKLLYDPSEISTPVVQKNTADWYFGTTESPVATPYAEPDISVPGQVVIIGGKLDALNPTAGVSGENVRLATVTFTRVNSTTIPTISLSFGKSGSFSNFVTNSGDVLDNTARLDFFEPVLNAECNLMADINNDGRVNYQDFSYIQVNWLKTGDDIQHPEADINKDGRVNYIDLSYVQSEWLQTCE